MGGLGEEMSDPALEYYRIKYGEDVRAAFVHIVAELGDLARTIEHDRPDRAVIEITEVAALMRHLADVYDFDLEERVAEFYGRKLKKLKGS
ncbi:MAG: hypothetical protein ACE5EW_07340 [Thermoplasmata archaeon]